MDMFFLGLVVGLAAPIVLVGIKHWMFVNRSHRRYKKSQEFERRRIEPDRDGQSAATRRRGARVTDAHISQPRNDS